MLSLSSSFFFKKKLSNVFFLGSVSVIVFLKKNCYLLRIFESSRVLFCWDQSLTSLILPSLAVSIRTERRCFSFVSLFFIVCFRTIQ